MYVTITEKLRNLNKYRKPSILFDDIKKIKLAEASDLQSKFKYELSDIERGQ